MDYCGRCDRYFPGPRALQQHLDNSSMHWTCHPCDRDFASWNGLKEHYVQSPYHSYCQRCDEHFDCENQLIDHYDNSHSYCSSCRMLFINDIGLHEHNRQKHWYCASCRRMFQSESNLNAHLKSSVHQPKNVRCLGPNCGRTFVSTSALMLHSEAGTCPSGMTREELNSMVIDADRNNMLTNPARLICGPDGHAPAITTETWATELSWNPVCQAYECFLCSREFGTLTALNQHLQSPRHQEKIYRCPNRTCGVEYSALSALRQHVESGKCGVQRFREVQNVLQSFTSGMKTITF